MKHLYCLLLVLCINATVAQAQGSTPFVADSLTRALWHFDELSGSTVRDTSIYHNNGTAYGTTIIEGPFGHARSFNGSGDYISFPSDSSMNFGNESFSIDLWLKTTAEEGVILRRGIAPAPGYMISMHYGQVVGQIGANVDAGSADPLLWAQTTTKYNDNFWHHVTLVRDRAALKVYLYVDDTLAAPPVVDNLTVPITTDRPLTIGRWESPDSPWFFAGSVDEVRLWSPSLLRRPVEMNIPQTSLNFGTIRVGSSKSLAITIRNFGFRDSLRIDSITSSTPSVQPSLSSMTIPPGGTFAVDIVFTPDSAQADTGSLVIFSNDPMMPQTRIPLAGSGIELTHSPIIEKVTVDPYAYAQARVVWFRSIDDTSGALDPVTQYSVWGRIDGGTASSVRTPQPAGVLEITGLSGTWQYLATIPAVGFDEYAASVPHNSTYSNSSWNTCIVVAQTKDFQTYLSAPDSLVPAPPSGVTGAPLVETPGDYALFQNFPNPFNPTTTIRVTLGEVIAPQQNSGHAPSGGERQTNESVKLVVYDMLGREVATLANGHFPPGRYSFSFDGRNLASGLYFYRLTAGKFTASRSMLLVR